MSIKVLVKTDRLLRLIAERPGIPFAGLQVATGLHKATLSNLLKTLTGLGYTRRDGAGCCHLGPALLEFAAGDRRRRTLPALAEEFARTVAEDLRETVTVGKLFDGDRFNLAKATVDRTVVVNAHIELRPSPYDTATGRVLLAFCSPSELERTVAKHGLPAGTWASTRAALEVELAAIRAAGHVELGHGDAHSFAVAVLTAAGEVLAAIGAAVPDYRLTDARRQYVLDTLRAAAERMAHALDPDPEERGA